MPERCRSAGEPMAPAARMTSRFAVAVTERRPRRKVTPTAVLPSSTNSIRHCTRDHFQVGPMRHGFQIGAGRRSAHTAVHGHLERAEALLAAAVAVVRVRVASLQASLDESAVERIAIALVAEGGSQRTVATTKVVGAGLPCLSAAEIGQAVAVAPSGCAESFPMVEVAPVPAHIDHAVDGRGTAKHLAARAIEPPAVEPRLRLRDIAPVAAPALHCQREGGRHSQDQAAVTSAGFDEQHAQPTCGRQSIRQHAASGTGSDDDVVVAAGCHSLVRLSLVLGQSPTYD